MIISPEGVQWHLNLESITILTSMASTPLSENSFEKKPGGCWVKEFEEEKND
jgi:hypothetical protein